MLGVGLVTQAQADTTYTYTGKAFDVHDSFCLPGVSCQPGNITAAITFDKRVTPDYTGPAIFDVGIHAALGIVSLTVSAFGITDTHIVTDTLCHGALDPSSCTYSCGVNFKNGKIVDWQILVNDLVGSNAIDLSSHGHLSYHTDEDKVGVWQTSDISTLVFGINRNLPGDWTGGDALSIVAPKKDDTPALSTNNFTQADVPFNARTDKPVSVQWDTKLEYATSGGKGSVTQQSTFTSQSNNNPTINNYISCGGRLTVNASATINGYLTNASPIKYVYIVGTKINKNLIASRLINLYTNNGTTARATPHLMTGIAQKESSSAQFETRTLYGLSKLWPKESPDGGSHIGIMQMEPTMKRAWDWLINTQDGVSWFSKEKWQIALLWENKIRKACTGLPPLTNEQRENMALVCYGPDAKNDVHQQYYDAKCVGGTAIDKVCKGGTWRWIKNVTGNPRGINYADTVRSLMVK